LTETIVVAHEKPVLLAGEIMASGQGVERVKIFRLCNRVKKPRG